MSFSLRIGTLPLAFSFFDDRVAVIDGKTGEVYLEIQPVNFERGEEIELAYASPSVTPTSVDGVTLAAGPISSS